MTEMEEGEKCHERYQQSQVTVLARFLAEDPDSGRRDYFISRNTLLDVTDLTRRSLRSSDPRVARLEGTKVQGASLGRTEVQVVSPLTGHVLGSTEVRVVKQRESVRGLKVRVVSGISLAVRPGVNADGTLVLSTTLGERLTSKYQVQKYQMRPNLHAQNSPPNTVKAALVQPLVLVVMQKVTERVQI